MRIEGTPPARATQSRREDRGVGGPSFADALDNTAPGAAAPRTQPPPAIDALLLLQEIAGDAQGARRRAVAHASDLLDRLDDLRHALLTGVLPRAQLAALATLAHERLAFVGDPRLAEILAEIELRAAVELAKLDAS